MSSGEKSGALELQVHKNCRVLLPPHPPPPFAHSQTLMILRYSNHSFQSLIIGKEKKRNTNDMHFDKWIS